MVDTAFYNRMVELVKRLMKEKGQTGSIRVDGVMIPDVNFVELSYSLNTIGSGVVGMQDRHIYMEPISVEPKANRDLLYIGGVAHKIEEPVNALAPAGIVIFYELRVTR